MITLVKIKVKRGKIRTLCIIPRWFSKFYGMVTMLCFSPKHVAYASEILLLDHC